jgi:PKD repeat protein
MEMRQCGKWILKSKAVFGVIIFLGLSLPVAAAIVYSPGNPNVEETVTFTVDTPGASEIDWDFGDGTPVVFTDGASVEHVFTRRGTYLVTANYLPGAETVTITIREKRRIDYTPANPKATQPITFTAVNFLDSRVRWDFGDGTVLALGETTEVHVYMAAGIYTVIALDMAGTSKHPIKVNVKVESPPSIQFAPARPHVGESVIFTALNFSSSTLIRWDFGDGTVENDRSPPKISHVYATSGSYLVRAYDGGGAQETARVSVIVLPPRLITCTPPEPRVGETAMLTAINFDSPVVDWDFGDGTSLSRSGLSVTHVFNQEGDYNVTAFDTRDSERIPVFLSVKVVPAAGPRAPFGISYLQLRFEDGKAYTVVPKESGPLRVFADIKYEGTGILQFQWLIDGNPFGLVTRFLAMADQITIDSGYPPGLPTLIPGLHEVTLQILQPKVEFSIPVIRYFVAAGRTTAGTAELVVDKVVSLDGRPLPLTAGMILAPVGKPFILNGRVRNASGHVWPYLLLRVRLNDKLIDQKLMENLKAGETKAFETSLINPTAESRRIILAVYDMTGYKPELLYIREFVLVNKGGSE